MSYNILEINGLTKHFPVKNSWGSEIGSVKALDGINLKIEKGKTFGIVGESGSGKSVMTSAILNDIPTSLKVTSGSIVFKNQDILKLSQKELNKLRGANISMIYQEPMAALNPSIRVG